MPGGPARSLAKTAMTSLSNLASNVTPPRTPKSQRSPKSGRQSPIRSPPLLLDNGEPQSLMEQVARDQSLSPSWREYHLNMAVFRMMLATDRGLPMTTEMRSPRHVSQHAKRIIPPPKPKPPAPSKMKRNDENISLLRNNEVERGPCACLWDIGNECNTAVMGLINGFLEQDLEVQIVILFVLISSGMSLKKQIVAYQMSSMYEDGMAPPAPPAQPDWTVTMSDSAMAYALSQPIIYLLIDFGIATVIGIIVLFWEDIKAWNKARLLKQEQERKAREEAEKGGPAKKKRMTLGQALRKATNLQKLVKGWKTEANVLSPRTRARQIVDPDDGPVVPLVLDTEDDVKRELMRSGDRVEELEIKLKVHTAAESPTSEALAKRLALHKERQKHLKEAYKLMVGEEEEKQSSEPVAVAAPKGLLADIGSSGAVTVLKNAATGFISVFMFFADVASDIAVIVLLWDTGNYLWAIEALVFVVGQFVVMYVRTLPYMHNTFGSNSCITIGFTYLGFPLGLLVLDFLMLLEPFGLLPVLPLPTWLKQFVPAYKATRVITEIAIESLPQSILQSYILVVTIQQVADGTAGPSILAMVPQLAAMPKSISISTLAILKTWMEIVQQSREAGISVKTKAQQLWNVGAGLPLDALKKGSIVDWACTYLLDDAEVPPLLDALKQNTSLNRLNLAEAGLDWDGAEGSAAPLVLEMNKSAAALSGLNILIISKASGFEIPIGALRAGPERALSALEHITFFAAAHGRGPWYTDIMFIGDVLRGNPGGKVVTEREQEAGEVVTQMLEDAHAGGVTRESWEKTTKQLIASGDLRRSQLQSLVGAECLRDVGFSAAELIGVGFSLVSLKNGQYTVSELRESGVAVRDLSATKYSAAELKEGGVVAAELKPLGYMPKKMRVGGYSAAELRAAKYALADLKGVYTAGELYAAEYPAAEMRRVGFEVAELKTADWRADLLRRGGYTAAEMRAGGFDASQTRAAGYSATEATAAGWSLEELKHASYDATGLRQAKHSAPAMREAGFTPAELRTAKYPTSELYGAGFNVEELRKAAIPIAELTAAGATIAEMRASGISAGGLKNENVRLKDMKGGGYTCKEVKAAGFSCKEVKAAGFVKGLKAGGYTIDEAVAARYGCEDLFAGGYSAEELLSAGFKPLEMRAVGFDAKALQEAGVTLPKLRAAGVQVGDLRSAGFGCEELRTVGVPAEEMHAGGVSAAELKEAGYPLAETRKLYPVGELRACGWSCEELRDVKFTAKEVSSTGATNKELREGGYNASELREIGVTAKELKVLQFTCAELKASGFNAKQLAAVGFGAHALKVGGFRARHVKDCGFKGSSVFGLAELKADGFRVPELRHDEGFSLDQMSSCFSVAELRLDGGVTAEELLDVGYSLTQMREGGFNASQLYKAGYGVQDMKKAGFTCLEVREAGFVEGIKEAGYSCTEARAAGYAGEIKRAGYSVKDLKDAGCTFAEVKAAGFIKGIKEAGYTCKEAKIERFNPKLLRAAGFTCAEAKAGGYIKDLKNANYSVVEARAAGCTCDDAKEAGYVEGLCAAGYTIEECFEAIYSCKQARMAGFVEGFKSAGYSITEAKVAGFTPEAFRAAGYDCTDFRQAEYTCKQAKQAGYSALEAKAAGWKLEEIIDAGYAVRIGSPTPQTQRLSE